MNEQLAAALSAALDRRLGAGHRVEDMTRLSGGASRETWRAVAKDASGTRQTMILKRDPPDATGPAGGVDTSLGVDRKTEHAAFQAAGSAGVPVPRTLFMAEPADGLGDGFVLEALEGETIARKILREPQFAEARPRLARQCGAAAAQIHAIDPATLPGLKRLDADAELAIYRQLLDRFDPPQPGFEFGLRWLQQHVPAGRPDAVVHGDFRNGNIIVGPDGLRAVLDWELAHIGDPMSDLGWICVRSWRYGADLPVGGFGTREDMFAAYEEAGGSPVDPAVVHYWEVFGTLRWGVMCMMMGFGHLDGAHRSVEMAAIGRRSAETEYDFLRLIEDNENSGKLP